jgi:hypothetical protein
MIDAGDSARKIIETLEKIANVEWTCDVILSNLSRRLILDGNTAKAMSKNRVQCHIVEETYRQKHTLSRMIDEGDSARKIIETLEKSKMWNADL